MTDELSLKQQKAVAALLETRTIAAAARAAQVSERTLYRWLNQDAFRDEVKQARRAAVAQATARLQNLSSSAVETLEQMLNDSVQPTVARVGTVRTALQYAYRASEVDDLSDRIAALEKEPQ